MKTIANLIVLIFEVIYYSIFMKNIKGDKKLSKYILTFVIATLSLLVTGNNLLGYSLFVLLCLFGMKYIVKTKTTFYDLFVLVFMILFKVAIELIICLLCYAIIKNTFIALMIANIVKILIVSSIRITMRNIYQVTKKLWDKNNFYFRYILMCLLYIYVICSVLFLIYR